MPDIRYVCLSDMHLGAYNSILTRIIPGSIDVDPTQADPLLLQLVACLRALIAQNEGPEKPTLILNGDILEMALAETNVAAMIFERLIELLFPLDGEALFAKNILYIPGNHDHHIWEIARETQYVNFLTQVPAGEHLAVPWHATRMFAPPLTRGYFLTDLLQRHPHLQDAQVSIIYPNYALLTDDGERGVLFHHGHYVESLYSLMSLLNTMIFPRRKRPDVVWDLEAENFAWIDFFWSTMGRSGNVGEDIGLLYDKLQDTRQVDQLLENFAGSVVERYGRFQPLEGIERALLTKVLTVLFHKRASLERQMPEEVLSSDAQQGLQSYLEGPLLAQMRIENGEHIPADLTFIFGHTHKPFSRDMHFAGYPDWTRVYNSGGWVVDTVVPSSVYGASVLLIDESLQVVALRMYNREASSEVSAVRVEESSHQDAVRSVFFQRINALVQPAREPWRTFSQAAAQAVRCHAQLLETKMNS